MNDRADWLAWSLQLLLGLFVGAVSGVLLISGRRRFPIVHEASPAFVLGTALIGAALASCYGDQLWMRGRLFPPDAPKQSRASRRASAVVGCVGGALVVLAVARSF